MRVNVDYSLHQILYCLSNDIHNKLHYLLVIKAESHSPFCGCHESYHICNFFKFFCKKKAKNALITSCHTR